VNAQRGAQEGGRPAAAAGEAIPRGSRLLRVTRDTARGLLKADEALGRVGQRSEHREDNDAQGEPVPAALRRVERQLNRTRERRRELDSVEGKLWARRNRLARFLTHTRKGVSSRGTPSADREAQAGRL
jgi:hypothetical protein